MADKFKSTLLAQNNDPLEIQKADLDLLKKINEVSSRISTSNTSTKVNEVTFIEPVVFAGYSGTLSTHTYVNYGAGTGCNVLIDTHNAMNITAGTWACPIEGDYRITVSRHVGDATTTRDITNLFINNTQYCEIVETSDQYSDVDGSINLHLLKGDIIDIRRHNSGLTKSGNITLFIQKVQTETLLTYTDPTINLTPTDQVVPVLSGRAGTAWAGALTAPIKIPFNQFWTDTGKIIYDVSTSRFSFTESGSYRITLNPFKNTGATATRVVIGLNTDTPDAGNNIGHCYSQSSVYETMCLDSVYNIKAGDYIVFYVVNGYIFNNPGDLFNNFTIQKIEDKKNDITIYNDCTFNEGGSIVNSYVEYDDVTRNFTTAWADGKTWATQNYRGNSKLRVDIHIPIRVNNSTSWTGHYTELQYSLNGSGWVSLGHTGYDGMHITTTSEIDSYNHFFLLDITTPEACTIAFKTRHRSYSGDLIVNGSHEIIGNEFFSKLVVMEIAKEPSQVVPANYGAFVRPAFYRYNTTDNVATQWIHMKTNNLKTETRMFMFHFLGYSYGEAKPIDASLGLYVYGPSPSAPINIGSSGTHTCGCYYSTDGYLVITFGVVTSCYYLGFVIDQIGAGPQGLRPITITASTHTGAATGAY